MSYSVRLEVFEGPLHLLLHLIRAQKLDIYDIPIASVTEQYTEYLALMEEMNLEVAGDFMLMAATLMEIKSRMLLPKPPREDADEGPDPREQLVQRLLEYEQFQSVAGELHRMAEESKRSFVRPPDDEDVAAPLKEMTPGDLLTSLRRMLLEQDEAEERRRPLPVSREAISLPARIEEVWERVRRETSPLSFELLLPKGRRTRRQIIVTFMAVLELLRQGRVAAWQEGLAGPIYLTPSAGEVDDSSRSPA